MDGRILDDIGRAARRTHHLVSSGCAIMPAGHDGGRPDAVPGIDPEAVRITCPADIRPAAERLRDLVRELTGLRIMATHNIAGTQATTDAAGRMLATDVFGWTDEQDGQCWRSPQFILRSPIATACRYESEPFWCNGEGARTPVANPVLRGLDWSRLKRCAVIRAAIVVPVHMPFARIGVISLVPRSDRKRDLSREFDRHAGILGVLGRVFLTSYVHVACHREALPSPARLSVQEAECLRWAAIGKTDIEIAMIMSRSRATVRFHIRNASAKLNAINRGQTVLRAAQLGYI